MSIAGRVALVTGGSRGIGKAVSEVLAERGCKVAVNYVSDQSSADETVAGITAGGGQAVSVRADVSDPAAVESMVAEVTGLWGPIEVLVNNAGVTTRGEVDLEAWQRVLAVNLTGAFLCCRAVIGSMCESKWGRIVNLSSTAGVQGAGELHYCASKAGLFGLTMALARQVAAHGVTVNAVSPSLVDTAFHSAAQRFVFTQNAKQLIPVGRLASPREIAEVVADLLGHPYVTGANLLAAGGVIMG